MKITICVCTYRRHHLLKNLLSELKKQQNDKLYSIEIVVVDNDIIMSARPIIDAMNSDTNIRIRYFHEPVKNISLARNRAVNNATGELIAFIDDDEIPSPNWLTSLFMCYMNNRCDGVLGPVISRFESPPPKWILKSKLLERPNPNTGVAISPADMRTGNALINRDIFIENKIPFNPKLGKIGGEDIEFFKKMVKKGHRFVWCREAEVYEIVPNERLTISYHLKRGINRGKARAIIDPFISISTIKSFIALILYFFYLPFSIIRGFSTFNKYLINLSDHIGRLYGYLRLFSKTLFNNHN